MPFICMPTVLNKTDEVLVQITDLFPHKTQSAPDYNNTGALLSD